MLTSNNKTSVLIPSQLPSFIRDDVDFNKFTTFVKAYYEWMEQSGQVMDVSKNLLDYSDVDATTDAFLDYFTKDFLPNFPKDALVDKRKALKIAKELYSAKGIPASYEFLFRLLYNNQDFDIFYTKDAVLKASDGKWYVTKSLKLSTTDPNWLLTDNYRIFGELTKSVATIEKAVRTGNKTEVFISDIERLFQSGESVRVIDNNGQSVLFDGEILSAKIVGQISQIKINALKRGLLYEPGDPVIVYGGLSSSNGVGAIAKVGTTTTGSIQRIDVLTGGYGYTADPQTLINITNGRGAIANVASLNPDSRFTANVNYVANNVIQRAIYTTIGNTQYSFLASHPTANANTALINALSFIEFTTYPISSLLLNNGGGGINKIPTVEAQSLYPTDIQGVSGDLKSLGILAPIQIISGGVGYQANDVIVFSGGSGTGARANVTNVSANGAITTIKYLDTGFFPIGGMGYRGDSLPSITVQSANGAAYGASILVPGILGDGATFAVTVDRTGSITSINVLDFGEDYIATPNVSLKVEDIVVSNVTISTLPRKGDVVFQGANLNVSTYRATVNSISLLASDNLDPTLSKYSLQVFEYSAYPNSNLPIRVLDKENIVMTMANTAFAANLFYIGSPAYNDNGVKVYGDGTANAAASFLNGLVVSQGQYLNSQGQPSSFDVLQSSVYNNFTYQITLEKEIAKYRDVLLSLLHPAGMKVLGRYAMKSNNTLNFHGLEGATQGHTLYYYTNIASSNVTMQTNFTNPSNNIIKFNNLGDGVNIADFIFSNSIIELSTQYGPNVISEIVSIDPSTNSVTLTTNTWLTFANVAYLTANANSNTINIVSLTGAYDIINNGNYSNTRYPLMDIVYAGDQILVPNNTAKVVRSIDYVHGVITLTSNLSANANGLMAVNRTYSAGGTIEKAEEIIIYGPVGLQYFPQLTTENGITILTEDGKIILLG